MKSTRNFLSNLKDPVCGMDVDPARSRFMTTHGGCTYYFCAEGCLKAFESNPNKYLDGKPVKHKGWWGRYLDRLEKATGGKAMHCH